VIQEGLVALLVSLRGYLNFFLIFMCKGNYYFDCICDSQCLMSYRSSIQILLHYSVFIVYRISLLNI
jgi:hypothetical protein